LVETITGENQISWVLKREIQHGRKSNFMAFEKKFFANASGLADNYNSEE